MDTNEPLQKPSLGAAYIAWENIERAALLALEQSETWSGDLARGQSPSSTR